MGESTTVDLVMTENAGNWSLLESRLWRRYNVLNAARIRSSSVVFSHVPVAQLDRALASGARG